MSEAVNVVGLIAFENTTVKLTGLVFVGSTCDTAWLIVIAGATLSKVIVLSVLELAVLLFVAGSCTDAAAIVAMIVPGPVTVIGIFHVILSLVVSHRSTSSSPLNPVGHGMIYLLVK